MLKTEFKEAMEKLLKNLDKIPERFWVETDGKKFVVVWFIDRQKPSVEASYDYDEERFGVTKEGNIIWGFDSGCSCTSSWSQEDYGDKTYKTSTWKEFPLREEEWKNFDQDWEDEGLRNLKDFLVLIDKDIKKVFEVRNAEIRSTMIKEIGFEKIKKAHKGESIHKDGDSELLKFGELTYIKVKDCSTSREFILEVPNDMKTCKQAIAWTFGLTEEAYNPEIET
jgi:hypothetical protein